MERLTGGTWTSPPVCSIHNGTRAEGSSRPRSSALINTLRLQPSFLENNEMKTGRKADKSPESRVAKIEGIKLHYLTAGQGPALILLHGYTQTSRMWRPLVDKLKHKFTTIAPDLPGIGDSDIPKGGS